MARTKFASMITAHRSGSDDQVCNDVPGDDLGVRELVDDGGEVDLLLGPHVRVVVRQEVERHEEHLHHHKLRRGECDVRDDSKFLKNVPIQLRGAIQ